MKEVCLLLAFWDLCVDKRAMVHNLLAKHLFQLNSSNTYAVLIGEEGDVSNLFQHGQCDWHYYRENANVFPFGKEPLGKFLGTAKGKANEMDQWVLKGNCEIDP